VWHAQFLVHGAHYTQKKILGWQATENLDEFSLLLQKWAAESPLRRGINALDER
jgi:hydroxyacylglutathione hydrolase